MKTNHSKTALITDIKTSPQEKTLHSISPTMEKTMLDMLEAGFGQDEIMRMVDDASAIIERRRVPVGDEITITLRLRPDDARMIANALSRESEQAAIDDIMALAWLMLLARMALADAGYGAEPQS